MKNILIPTDFSDNAWNAAAYAISLFDRIPCNFHFLHVSSVYERAYDVYAKTSTILRKSEVTFAIEEKFRYLLQKIKQLPHNPFHSFETAIDYIFLVDSIRKYVEEKEIDYIVMGTRGDSEFNNNNIGRNTRDVLTKVKCPIYVIPEKARYKKIEEIAFLTDHHTTYTIDIQSKLKDLLKKTEGSLSIFEISKYQEILSELQIINKLFLSDVLSNQKHSFYYLSTSNLKEQIQKLADREEIGLITMVAKNLNFFQKTIFQPEIQNDSYQNFMPFLILHD